MLECSVDITTDPLPQNVPFPTFEWFFDSTNTSLPSGVTVSDVTNSGNTYTSILQFSPLLVSHTGMYTCRFGDNRRLAANTMITVNPGKHNQASLNDARERLYYTVPSTVMLTSNVSSNLIRPIGTDVILTCIVELTLTVDAPVSVNTVWTGPDGVTLSPTSPVMESLTRYTSTAMVNSFGRAQSGNYTWLYWCIL